MNASQDVVRRRDARSIDGRSTDSLPTLRANRIMPGDATTLALARLIGAIAAACIAQTAIAGGKSDAACRQFADLSEQQLKTSGDKHCGFAAGWNGTWQQNYDYCRRAEPSSTDQIAHNRLVMMSRCTEVCPAYANAAVNDIRIATQGGCINPARPELRTGVSGPPGRWTGDYNAHFAWCMSGVSDKVLNREHDVRATEAPRCQICSDYSKTTALQAQEQRQKHCDYDRFNGGDQWSTDPNLHFRHCMGYPLNQVRGWAQGQTAERQNELASCPSAATQAMCRRVATHAVEQRNAIDTKTTTGFCGLQGLDNSRWNKDYNVHYRGCLLNPQTSPGEEAARDAHLKECGIIKKAGPATNPAKPGEACNVGVVLKLVACNNQYDEPVDYFNPGDVWPACGLGATDQSARSAAMSSFASVGLILNNPPAAGQCSYTSTTIRGCSCGD